MASDSAVLERPDLMLGMPCKDGECNDDCLDWHTCRLRGLINAIGQMSQPAVGNSSTAGFAFQRINKSNYSLYRHCEHSLRGNLSDRLLLHFVISQ